jgi:hypothetical protein
MRLHQRRDGFVPGVAYSLTHITTLAVILDLFPHIWPIKVLLDTRGCPFIAKVSSQRRIVSHLNYSRSALSRKNNLLSSLTSGFLSLSPKQNAIFPKDFGVWIIHWTLC